MTGRRKPNQPSTWHAFPRRLTALDEPGLHHLFVKAAVSLSLDRKDRERELVCKLLVALCPQVGGACVLAAKAC